MDNKKETNMYKFLFQDQLQDVCICFGILWIYSNPKMPIAFLPNVDYPVVSVITNYDQGSTEIIESKITDKIEEAISGISGIDIIRSDTSKINQLLLLNLS